MEATDQSRGIILKEYGRNIQKIVEYLLTIEDREKRSRYAYTLIELMKQINPNIKEVAIESAQKIWDHLYIMSDFKLDVDSEYPMPEKSILGKKPMTVDYNTHNLKFKHYGKNVELLIKQAIELEDPEEKEAAILFIGKLMKRFYAAWNKENIEDQLIAQQLEYISNQQLRVDLEKVKANGLFDSQKEYTKVSNQPGNNYANGNTSSGSGSSQRNANFKKNRKSNPHNNNNRRRG